MQSADHAEFMPVPEAFRRMFRPDDRFIVSYPRSGTRWLRLLLTDLINQQHGYQTRGIYENALSRELCTAPSAQEWLTCDQVAPCVYHPINLYSPIRVRPLFQSHNLTQIMGLDRAKVVYTFRRPVAALCSYYFFLQNEGHEAVAWTGIDDFCWCRYIDWTIHLETALSFQQRAPDRLLLLSYGAAEPFTTRQLQAAASWLDISHTPAMIDNALGNLRAFFSKLNRFAGRYRRGTNVQPAHNLAPATARRIERRTAGLFKQATRMSVRQLRHGAER